MKRFQVDFCLDLTLNGVVQAPDEDNVYEVLSEELINDLRVFFENKGYTLESSNVHDEFVEEE